MRIEKTRKIQLYEFEYLINKFFQQNKNTRSNHTFYFSVNECKLARIKQNKSFSKMISFCVTMVTLRTPSLT